MTSNTLLAVCGCTPQVITETLYALFLKKIKIDRVVVLTTISGKAACNAHLFDPKYGHFIRFLKDFRFEGESIDFTSRNVIAVEDMNGNPISDISSEDDNEYFLRACMETAFQETRDSGSRVFFSIAGGRKTMGACLALAAQFYGRRQDRIYHVLVSPEFENSKDFFYPPPKSRPVSLRDEQGQPYVKETRYAKVTLVHMPFVSVRERLSEGMLKAPEDPAALLLSMVREERPRLIVDLRERKLSWKGIELDMPPARLALYAFFAQIKKTFACEKSRCGECLDCFISQEQIQDSQEELTALYEKRIHTDRVLEGMSDTGIVALNQENFNSYRSKINKDIQGAFGLYDGPSLSISACGEHGAKRYGIPIEKEAIEIRW